jgi:hypothetical protein
MGGRQVRVSAGPGSRQKRLAAGRQVALADTVDATRWRRSTDKVVGMTASPQQPPATQHSFRSDEPRSSRSE